MLFSDVVDLISIIASITSIALAGFAVFYAWQADSRATSNYNATLDILSKIDTQAGVIKSAVGESQQKLLETVLEAAKPKKSEQEQFMDMLRPTLQNNPEWIQNLVQQGFSEGLQKGLSGDDAKSPKPNRAARRRKQT